MKVVILGALRALALTTFAMLAASCSAQEPSADLREPSADLRVLTLNLQTFAANPAVEVRTEMVIKYLRSEMPDLVALQEAAQSSEVENRAEAIAAAAGYEYVWTSADMNEPQDYRGGTAVLSRWPITQKEIVDLPFLGVEGEYQSRAILITADTPVGKVKMVGVHVTTIEAEDLKARQTIAGAALLVSALGAMPGFYAGDFNAEPNAPSILQLDEAESGFVDAWAAANPGAPGYSYPSSGPDRRIDYIFTAAGTEKRATVKSCTLFGDESTDGIRVSDHLGILCDFRLRPAR
tara:strand:+ start:19748 stop:20626 length:879 start_codon:yes stop_codon:yes gene_type:complete